MKRPVFALHCLFLLAAADAYAETGDQEAPQLSDYAWGFPIAVGRDASFYSIELPLEVNQSISDPDLRDAGVYNAAGTPLTRVFGQLADDVEQTEHLEPLPILPLYKNSENSADDVRLLFEREGDRTRVEFGTDGLEQAKKGEQLKAYIVDIHQFKHSIESLEFSWNALGGGFVGRITVDGSNDLQDWSDVGSGAIADLHENDASIIQRRVKLRGADHDYLRVRWENMPEDWSLTGIRGSYTTGVANIVRKAITLEASSEDPEDGGRIFDLGGAPIIDRVRVVLPQPNTVISATIYYWSEHQQRWLHAASGSHHHIGRANNVFVSDAVRINKVRVDRFKVVVTRGRPDTVMQLEVGWRPDSLIFLAQGGAPFTLAAGRAADAEDGFPQQRVYGDRAIINLSAASGNIAAATLGPRYPLGGANNLRVTRPADWRQLSLWIGLILGVAFVGFMAAKVVRDLRTE